MQFLNPSALSSEENDVQSNSGADPLDPQGKKDHKGKRNYRAFKSGSFLNPDGSETTMVETSSIGGVSRTEGPGISYGKPVEINAGNISQLGLGNDIVTHFMDKNGHLSVDNPNLSMGSDFAESSPEEFLAHFGEHDGKNGPYSVHRNPDGTTSVSGYEDKSFNLQRVEVGGVTQGYFVYNDYGPHKIGFYLGPNAIDYAGLDKKTRSELEKPETNAHAEPKSGFGIQNTAAPAVNTGSAPVMSPQQP